MYREPFTGKYHTQFRDYDPLHCKWLSRDPIAEAGGVNLSGYCGNNGLDYVDDMGLEYGFWTTFFGGFNPWGANAAPALKAITLRTTAEEWGQLSTHENMWSEVGGAVRDAPSIMVKQTSQKMTYYHDVQGRSWAASVVQAGFGDPVLSAVGVQGMMEAGFGVTTTGEELDLSQRAERGGMGLFQAGTLGAATTKGWQAGGGQIGNARLATWLRAGTKGGIRRSIMASSVRANRRVALAIEKRITDPRNIRPYKELRKVLRKTGLSRKYEAHKLVEKRHGIGKYRESPAVALRKGQHQAITNRLRSNLRYGVRHSADAVRESILKTYAREDWQDAAIRWIDESSK